MSDFDDELLDLVEGASGKERKRKRGGSSKTKGSHGPKRRKADVSDDETESDEGEADPYPLEGKYVDEADMHRLLQMPEIEREEIIATRLEERQKIQDKKAISQLLKEQRERGDLDAKDGATGVARAAKREHTARGATKEKSSKLDELKAKRRAKDEKSKNRAHSPKRERSSSPMDMETSSDDDEDGVITKNEQAEERERRLLNGNSNHRDDSPATIADLERCRLSRTTLLKHLNAPWLDQYVKGMWVRFLIGSGNDPRDLVYRICQVSQLVEEPAKPYKIEGKMFDRQAELVHGKAKKNFQLDKISNSPFTPKEFERLQKVLQADGFPMPSKAALDAKAAEISKLGSQRLTESDISAMLAKKRQLSSDRPTGWTTLERSRLNQARTLAFRRQDTAEVAELDAQIAEFDALHGPTNAADNAREDGSSVLMKLSEKNRKANLEAVRRAEQLESERRRRERKLAQSGSGTATPTDPSARLRIVPRTFNAKTPTPAPSRPTTPAIAAQSKPEEAANASPMGNSGNSYSNGKSFEASVIASLEVDLGDF